MQGIFRKRGLTEIINLVCLITGIFIIILLPLKKEIWYDETVSILISKGISPDTKQLFADNTPVSSATLHQFNTIPHVFEATVSDNANSFIYNLALHWYTQLCGNTIAGYMWFSKLIAIATLIAFWFLCKLFFNNNIFTSVAILLLSTDIDFVAMSHEIRAYAMGILFITLAAVNFYKFMYRAEKPVWLFLTGLFSVAAVLCHFLSVYVVVVFLVALIYNKGRALFATKNIIAIVMPVLMIAAYFLGTYSGLQTMSRQNHEIQERALAAGFSNLEVMSRAMKFTAVNLKLVFPSFMGSRQVIIMSFLLAVALYGAGIKLAKDKEQKSTLHLLLALSAGSSIFLALLCAKSHHYTALYYRYFSFCLPFCCLFVAYLLYLFFTSPRIKNAIASGIAVVIILPSVLLFVQWVKNTKPVQKYNFTDVAGIITASGYNKIEVPQWRDAFLINALLPDGYKIDYFRNPAATEFTVYKAEGITKIPVIRNDE